MRLRVRQKIANFNMDALHIENTGLTPLVHFDTESFILRIEGKMIPENVEDTFTPINHWIGEYLNENNKLHLLFRLYYYNTSSARQFFLMYKKLDTFFKAGKDVHVRWEFEDGDEDSMNDAEEFLTGVSFPFQIVPVEG